MALASGARAEAPPGTIEEFPLALAGWAELGSLAVGSEGSLWLTENVDHDGVLGWIRRFSQSGVVTGEFSIPLGEQNGSDPYLPLDTFPTALTRGPDGNMWFADDGRNFEGRSLIGRITPAGVVKEYPVPAAPPLGPPENAEGPLDLTAGADADVWFTYQRDDEAGHSFIGRITSAGLITEYPVPTGSGVDVPTSSAPTEIALGADGNMWFTDRGANGEGRSLIGRIAPSGAIVEFPIPAVHSEPGSIALGADGNMWFVETGVDRIGRITPTGEITEFEALPGGGEPIGLALGPDGNIWFTGGYMSPAIGWITPSGNVREISKALLGNALPSDILAGSDGNIWFTDYRPAGAYEFFGPYGFIGRLITPYPPANIEAPSISGQGVEGGRLIASEGSWTHDPSEFAYQWQRCDASGLDCQDISGGVEATYVAEASDVGHVLRVAVTAANIAGSASMTSDSSAVVQGTPSAPIPPLPPRPPAVESIPLLGATLTWSFRWSHEYTIVRSLLVNEMPVGGFVDVLCRGRGCPFAHRRVVMTIRRSCHARRCAAVRSVSSSGELNLATLLHAGRLRPGARLTVSLVEDSWIGKSYVFDVRKNQVPSSLVTCLMPGSASLSHVC
jgi:streptogramin lyase